MIELIVVILLIAGFLTGFKIGVIKSGASLIATVVFAIIAWTLKNPLAINLMKFCPFFEFKDTMFEGVTVLNILLYEVIAFLIIFSALSIILMLIVKVSGVIEKILNATIILGFPFKVIGGILGVIETYIIIFICLFIITQINVDNHFIRESYIAPKILESSPVLSSIVTDTYKAGNEIYEINNKYKNDKEKYNSEALNILLKYKVITKEQVTTVIDNGKLKIKGYKKILEKY